MQGGDRRIIDGLPHWQGHRVPLGVLAVRLLKPKRDKEADQLRPHCFKDKILLLKLEEEWDASA